MVDSDVADRVLGSLQQQLDQRYLKSLDVKNATAVDLFRKLDSGGDGTVSQEEFFACLNEMGFQCSSDEVDAVVKRLDKDGSGDISLKELSRTLLAKSNHAAVYANATPRSSIRGSSKASLPAVTMTHRNPPVERLDAGDELLIRVAAVLNRRKIRMIDVFRNLDASGDGALTAGELKSGLAKYGLALTPDELRLLIAKVDKDRGGQLEAKEFDKALKQLTQKLKAEGREHEVETWELKVKRKPDTAYDWCSRSIKHNALMATSKDDPTAFTSLNTASLSIRDAKGASWSNASRGPVQKAADLDVGSGSILDASTRRLRLPDSYAAPGAKPFALKQAEVLGRKVSKNTYPGRFGKEPVNLASDEMLNGARFCKGSVRSYERGFDEFDLGVRKFSNTPMLQSTMDTIIFGHDTSPGNDSFDEDYLKMFEGARGISSWHRSAR